MSSKAGKNTLALVGLDIGGEWNVPLLRNAAEVSGASLLFARTGACDGATTLADGDVAEFEALFDRYDHVVACETGKKSRSIYTFAVPRGRTAVVVGNERSGIPRETLSSMHEMVSVPMHGKGMTSVNVAVAAAIVLYAFERDLGRTGVRKSKLTRTAVDVLIRDPDDPSEVGSLLRSAWAFGWRKVYLSDRNCVWFTKDRAIVTAGRAAARREVNPLVVAPADQMNLRKYKAVIQCSHDRSGTPLSRFVLADSRPILIVLGEGENHLSQNEKLRKIYVDHGNSQAVPCFRHTGSIVLSVISEMLRGGGRG